MGSLSVLPVSEVGIVRAVVSPVNEKAHLEALGRSSFPGWQEVLVCSGTLSSSASLVRSALEMIRQLH